MGKKYMVALRQYKRHPSIVKLNKRVAITSSSLTEVTLSQFKRAQVEYAKYFTIVEEKILDLKVDEKEPKPSNKVETKSFKKSKKYKADN